MKRTLKRMLPPWLLDRIEKYKYNLRVSEFHGMPIEEVFTNIYRKNHWGNTETASGQGSGSQHMKHIVVPINCLISELNVKRLLDIPCGDFNWVQHIDLTGIDYTGADIVDALIEKNNKEFCTQIIRFDKIDLTKDRLPTNDLILNKDCFVHFSYNDIFKALYNIKLSGSHYLMTTTFTKHGLNRDITTGDWRPLNLEEPPFQFPKPLKLIPEYCEVGWEMENKGKALGVWQIENIPNYE